MTEAHFAMNLGYPGRPINRMALVYLSKSNDFFPYHLSIKPCSIQSRTMKYQYLSKNPAFATGTKAFLNNLRNPNLRQIYTYKYIYKHWWKYCF